ncbi:helix-hairpin-helix domain-containing protein [Chloroflexota bacterium]
MTTGTIGKYWTLAVVLLVSIIALGGIVALSKHSAGQPIEISIIEASSQEPPSLIYVGGAVVNPGLYPLKARDGIESLLQAAGGATSSADLSQLKLYIPNTGRQLQPQQIDLNRAEAWLLESLPGIGRTRAQAIIEYRHRNGLFRNTGELTKVEGIGTTTYEKIKHLITVAD